MVIFHSYVSLPEGNQDWRPHSVEQYGVGTILSDDPVAVAVSRPRFEGGAINMSFFNIVQPSSELPQPTFFLAVTLSITVVRYRNMELNSWVMVSSNIRFSYCFLQVPCGKSGVDPKKTLHGRQRRKRGKNPCSRRSPRRALSRARFHGDDDIMGLSYIWKPQSWCLIILLTS